MLLQGRIPAAALDAVADYFTKLATDLRRTSEYHQEREAEAAKARHHIQLAHKVAPRVRFDGVDSVARRFNLPAFQVAAIARAVERQQIRAQREYRDSKIVQLVGRGWSNAAIARELQRRGVACHAATITRVWKRHLKLREPRR